MTLETLLETGGGVLAAAYLLWLAWLASPQALAFLKAWRKQRSLARRLASPSEGNKRISGVQVLWLPGLSAGALLALLAGYLLPGRWLLLALAVLGLCLEEMREPRGRACLPDVIVLLVSFRAAVLEDKGIFDALKTALPKLPPGDVHRAVKLAMKRHWEGQPPEKCLAALAKCSPHTNELVSILRRGAWQAAPVFEATIDLLIQRVRGEWNASAHNRHLIERFQPWVRFGRGLAAGGLVTGGALYAGQILGILPTLPVMTTVWSAAASLALVVVVQLLFTQPWLRRAFAVGALVACFVSLTYGSRGASAQPVMPTWTPETAITPLPAVTSAPLHQATIAATTPTATPPPIPTSAAPALPTSTAALPPTGIPSTSRPPTRTSEPTDILPSSTPPNIPTNTVPALPTSTRQPTATPPEVPTSTAPSIPTATQQPPTESPPTATPLPPTDIPPSATPPLPPTEAPPTDVPPTATPPPQPQS